jgi:DNA-binding NtrC family response regulator
MYISIRNCNALKPTTDHRPLNRKIPGEGEIMPVRQKPFTPQEVAPYMAQRKVLIIDDEQAVLNFLRVLLAQSGQYQVEILNDSTLAFDKLAAGQHDLLLLDMDMPRVTGLDILKHIQENKIDIETIVLTGVDEVELAVSAMKLGAYDYLKKPVDNDLLLLTMERATERKSMRLEIAALRRSCGWETVENKKAFEEIITQSPRMIQIFKIAATSTSVLILGESGTGKELIARATHKASLRSDKAFIAVNAGAFARDLFASEFFGHIKGAFSGAFTDKKGFIEEAHGGTLFLDEIGELPPEVQVKLLRVLQNGEFFRVGSTRPMRADVRLLAATNKNLWQELERGTFRKDLFYRLNVNTVSLPPLREREGDIPLLCQYFLQRFNADQKKSIRRASDGVLELLHSYSFPGNVRELENLVTGAALMEQSDVLTADSFPPEFLAMARREEKHHPPPPSRGGMEDGEAVPVKTLEEIEASHIKKVLEMTGGNRSHAAKRLGISRVTLIAKIKKFRLESLPFTDGE